MAGYEIDKIDDETYDKLNRLLEEASFESDKVAWDLWLQHGLVAVCCGSHRPEIMQWPWAYCHCCGDYSIITLFDLGKKRYPEDGNAADFEFGDEKVILSMDPDKDFAALIGKHQRAHRIGSPMKVGPARKKPT